MSKNFEKEYIELTQVEVPDLWDRIEAGLTPKSAQNFEKIEASIIDFKKEAASLKEAESISGKGNQKKTPVYFIKKYKTVFAAAVCVVVILPAAVLMGKMGIGTGGAKESAAEEAAPAEMMEYAVTTEAAAEEWEVAEEAEETEAAGMAEESMDTEIFEEAAEAASEDAGAYEAKESLEEAVAENDAMQDVMEELRESEAKANKSQSTAEGLKTEAAEEERAAEVSRLDVEDGTILSHVKVRVYAKEEVSSNGEAGGLGNLYRAEVLEDADNLLVTGQEILIYIDALSSTYWPDEESIYDVMLEYDGNREYPFLLKSCY